MNDHADELGQAFIAGYDIGHRAGMLAGITQAAAIARQLDLCDVPVSLDAKAAGEILREHRVIARHAQIRAGQHYRQIRDQIVTGST